RDGFLFVRGFIRSERDQLFQNASEIKSVLASMKIFERQTAGKRRSKIEKVMTQEMPAVFLDVHVEALFFFHVDVIDPGGNQTQTSNFAPVLMRNQVIRIVAPDPDMIERALGLSREDFAGENAVPAVWQQGRILEHFLEIALLHGPLLSSVSDLDTISDLQAV